MRHVQPFCATYCFLLFSLPGRSGCLQGCLHGGRKILEGGTTFRWVTRRNCGPCGAQVKNELKTAGDKNKNAIWALLLLLALTTTFLQNYHNNQVLVTPNEMVGLLPSVTTRLPAAIFFFWFVPSTGIFLAFFSVHVNRNWTFCTLRPMCWANSPANRLHKSKDH